MCQPGDSSVEERLAQAQVGSTGQLGVEAGASSNAHLSGGDRIGEDRGDSGGAAGNARVNRLEEVPAHAEETVVQEIEKDPLYSQGAGKIPTAATGEDAGEAGGDRIQTLADFLKKVDDEPNNLKDMFRRVGTTVFWGGRMESCVLLVMSNDFAYLFFRPNRDEDLLRFFTPDLLNFETFRDIKYFVFVCFIFIPPFSIITLYR